MTETPSEKNGTRKQRYRKYLLVGSLALNFLVIGAVIGTLLSDGPRKLRAPQGEFEVGPFTRALGEEDKQTVQKNLRDKISERGHDDRRKARELLLELIEAIRADPFDPERVLAQFKSMNQLGESRRVQGESALVEAISKMSAEDRIAYADRLENQFRKRRNGPQEKRPKQD